jgi:hypothetical protein
MKPSGILYKQATGGEAVKGTEPFHDPVTPVLSLRERLMEALIDREMLLVRVHDPLLALNR